MPFSKTAMARAIFRPLCPPIAPPTTTSNTLSRMSSTPVLRIFMTSVPGAEICVQECRTAVERAVSRAYPPLDSRGSCGLFRWRALKAHRVLLPIAVHAHMISGQHSSFKDLQGQRILDQALNGSAQRPCPIGGLVALLQQQLFRRGRQLQGNLPFGKQLLYILQQQAHDALQMLFPERVKGHDLVDAVDELRQERSTQCFRRFSVRQLRIFVS